jgi:stress response protein YsnF
MTKIAVALYDDDKLAQETVDALISAGIPRGDISTTSHATMGPDAGGGVSSTSGGPLSDRASGVNLFEKLNNLGVPRDEAEAYAEGTRRGGSLVLVRTDDAHADQAASIMEQRQFVDYESRSEAWRAEGWTGYEASAEPFTPDAAAAERARYSDLEAGSYAPGIAPGTTEEGTTEPARARQATEEGTIPVVEEGISIDKRARKGRVRIHTHVEEKPVEETVRLRDEEVVVERRAADRPLTDAEAETAFRETDVEIDETREEAVVSKEARVVEEVAIGKESREREEVVRDTVRRTEVEVEDTTERSQKRRQ